MSPTPLTRVLLYSHDTYGLGHLRRNLAISRHLLSQERPPRVVLASGSPVIDQIALPAGITCVQLPPVVKTGDDTYEPIDSSMGFSLTRRARSAVLIDVLARWKPDVLLVDHAPQGLKGELLPVFDQLERVSPRTKVVLGLRDILDEGSRVRAKWRHDDVYETLRTSYDQILVYGRRDVFDVAAAYGIPEPVASRLEYCGYITNEGVEDAPHDTRGAHDPYVLGTIGGGGDGVDVLSATARAAHALGLRSVLCTGPFIPASDLAELQHATRDLKGVTILESIQDVVSAARNATAVVTRGGYNTLSELVRIGARAVVVPRCWPRREQQMRAQVFADHGLVELVDEGEDIATRLGVALQCASTRRAPDAGALGANGVTQVARALREVIQVAETRHGAFDEELEVPA